MRQPSHTLTPTLLTIATLLFWRHLHPETLSCAEELQLFLFTPQYLLDHLTYPGGPATYIGEFLTQFYNPLTLGALILALLTTTTQLLTWQLMRLNHAPATHYPLSLLTPITLITLMGDENLLLTYTIDLLIGLLAATLFHHLYTRHHNPLHATLTLIPLIPLTHYIAGPAAYLLATYALITLLRQHHTTPSLITLLTLTLTHLIAYRLTPYPLTTTLTGIGIYRMTLTPTHLPLTLALIPLIPTLAPLIPAPRNPHLAPLTYIPLTLLLILLPRATYTQFNHRVMHYDLLLRQRDWDAIITYAQNNTPRSPLELATLNLALAMQRQLPNHMFEYPQVNSEGLIPLFSREVFTTMMTTDIYFELGMLNTAQRFAFEAQESIPNGQKSGRLTRRLAEIAIIDGHYNLARRYLHILSHTYAHHTWAQQNLQLLNNPQAINHHPLYSLQRQRRLTSDFFYSDTELDQMLGLLFLHDTSNQLALDYLLACELLTRNIPAFNKYLPLMAKLPNHGAGPIPRAYQEALCMIWAQSHPNFNGIPYPIDPHIQRSFIQFTQLPHNTPLPPNNPLSTTYWAFYTHQSTPN